MQVEVTLAHITQTSVPWHHTSHAGVDVDLGTFGLILFHSQILFVLNLLIALFKKTDE
mgnify:CR=1 FL=1